MKYLVVDNQMQYGATEEIKEFEILEDAMEYAEYSWNCMSNSDKMHTTAYYLLESVNPDEESDDHYDGDIIKRWKWGNNMERALNKILEIISDMSQGIIDDNMADFYRGYLFALNENREITTGERLMLISFYDRLVANKSLFQNRR